jgi:small subunit ribosomal protein S21
LPLVSGGNRLFFEGKHNQPRGKRVTMIEVEVKGDIEYAIRQLKKKLQMDGVKKELKRREFYEKPSVKRRRKSAESKRKLRKIMMRMERQ